MMEDIVNVDEDQVTQPHDTTGWMVVEPRLEFMWHQDGKEFFQILDDMAGTDFGWINHECS
jgi:hypothetical protein